MQRFIDRELQLPLLQFKPPVIEFPARLVYRDKRGRKVCDTVWHQQPAKFPKGYTRMAKADPINWRAVYQENWIQKRLALGLPHHITNRVYRRKAA